MSENEANLAQDPSAANIAQVEQAANAAPEADSGSASVQNDGAEQSAEHSGPSSPSASSGSKGPDTIQGEVAQNLMTSAAQKGLGGSQTIGQKIGAKKGLGSLSMGGMAADTKTLGLASIAGAVIGMMTSVARRPGEVRYRGGPQMMDAKHWVKGQKKSGLKIKENGQALGYSVKGKKKKPGVKRSPYSPHSALTASAAQSPSMRKSASLQTKSGSVFANRKRANAIASVRSLKETGVKGVQKNATYQSRHEMTHAHKRGYARKPQPSHMQKRRPGSAMGAMTMNL
jgi:hypothetical protein